MSYIKTVKIRNGNSFVDYQIYECDVCGSKIEESWPHLYFPRKDFHICNNCPINFLREGTLYTGIEPIIILKGLLSEFSHLRKKRTPLSKKIRLEILDKYNCKCCICGSKNKLEIDHIRPISKGGSNDLSNLQVLCKSCNLKKSNKWKK